MLVTVAAAATATAVVVGNIVSATVVAVANHSCLHGLNNLSLNLPLLPHPTGYARTAEIVLNITLDALSGDFSGVEATDGGFGRQLGGAVRAARAGGDGSNDEDGAEIHFHKAKQRERAFLHRARVRSIAMALFLNNFAFLGGFCSLHAGLIGRLVDTETFPARWHFALTVGLSAAAAPLLAVVSASAMG